MNRFLFLLFLWLVWLPHTSWAWDAPITLTEQIALPHHMPREVAFEALRTRLWLHGLEKSADSIKQKRLLALSVPPHLHLALAHSALATTITEEWRNEDTITLRATLSLRDPKGNMQEERLALVNTLVEDAKQTLLALDSVWPSGHIYTEPKALPPAKKKPLTQNWLKLANTLKALWLTQQAITPLQTNWLTQASAQENLEEANRLHPKDPRILTLLGEACLLHNNPQKALDYTSLALSIAPQTHRARYIRALGYWKMHQLGLAENDLSLAIDACTPKKAAPSYYRERGTVRMILGKTESMCADFHTACQMGDCEGLKYARSKNLCPHDP
ncbi:MAG: hypothetical protein IJS54_04910 [Desulfovibrio sp.]|nr:hypothetical protein [Desulfovibrio sp.]